MEDNKTQTTKDVTPIEAFEFIFDALEKVAVFPLPAARTVDAFAEIVREALEKKQPEQ